VLEQRVGRVHRLGQARPVRVLSFVAKGTIEEGMLSVLSFKRSLFAGVLDDGASEVFLDGSRLQRFMDSIDRVTAAIPAPAPEETPPPEAQEVATDGEPPEAAAGPPSTADPWAAMLRSGLELIDQLAAPAGHAARVAEGAASPPLFERVREERTGQSYLRIRMPEPEVVDRLAGALQALLESLRA
jgi:hypothetical protein